jgi:hypothetical protein
MEEYFGDQEPLFESGVEVDYQIEIDSNHPTGTMVEATSLSGRYQTHELT